MLRMKSMQVGPIDVNCYIVYDSDTLDAMIIDAGSYEEQTEEILKLVKAMKLHVVRLLNTHGHFDHIGGWAAIRRATKAPLCIHEADASMLTDSHKNMSAYMGMPISLEPADQLLEDGQEFKVGKLSFKVLHTPGHSQGSICLYGEGVLFSGDTVFAGSVGRTDFPGSSQDALLHSIKDKLLPLPDETKLYPGHGGASTLEMEKRYNPFFY